MTQTKPASFPRETAKGNMAPFNLMTEHPTANIPTGEVKCFAQSHSCKNVPALRNLQIMLAGCPRIFSAGNDGPK